MAMNGWDEGDPAWWRNLEAHPEAVVKLRHERPRPLRARRALVGRMSALALSIRRPGVLVRRRPAEWDLKAPAPARRAT